jgi:AcrR family transcriptional regulator
VEAGGGSVGVVDGGVDPAAPAPVAGRPMRADAVKNRQRILVAAEEVFADRGVAAPIDDVAERAGVGIGTLYRHFPNKEALFEAIVLTRLEELAAAAAAPPGAGDPGEALFAFLREFAGKVSNKHDLIDALGAAGIDIKSRCADMVGQLEAGVDGMLARAQGAGAIRPGLTTREVMGLIMGVCQAGEHSELDGASRLRMLDVVCDGLRPPSGVATGPPA